MPCVPVFQTGHEKKNPRNFVSEAYCSDCHLSSTVYCLRYVLGNNHIDLFVYEYFTRIVLKMFLSIRACFVVVV